MLVTDQPVVAKEEIEMLFELQHQTVFEYSDPVSESYMEFRLTPATDTCQRVVQSRQFASPAKQTRQYVDHVGNTVTYFNVLFPHDRVEVNFESVVETFAGARMPLNLAGADPLSASTRLALHDYLQPTRLTTWSPLCLEYAKQYESLRGARALEIGEALHTAIFKGFRYDTEATTSSSTIDDLLTGGAGVCQDFSHLMIATCRWLGMPARYVSGYVFTESNSERAVASHAWVELFDPDEGWLGVDPTHNIWVQEHHVRLGVGRDYSDVAPNRGVYRGIAEERVTVSVLLRPIDPGELEQSARRFFTSQQLRSYATRQTRKPPPVSILQQTSAAQQQQQQQQ
jgi:transglutaminase-like putative cysteine protease